MLEVATHQCTDHHNTDGQSIPQTAESDVTVDAAHGGTKSFASLTVCIELADHHVGRVRDHSTENTGQVTTSKRNGSLRAFVVV